MRINELRERLERLENNLFMIYMVDRWTSEDEKRANLIEREIEEIKNILGYSPSFILTGHRLLKKSLSI